MQQNINKSVEWLTSKAGLLTVLTVAVCAAVLIVHWPVLSAQALYFDDNSYVMENFLVRSPGWESAKRFFAEVFEPSTVKGYYQPLTMISLMIDYAISGQTDNLMQFHLTNLILHIANTALIIFLLYQLFGKIWIATGLGLLFGVHPLTVEPISWVCERKTLLAAFFILWSLVLYVRFAQKNNWKTYIGCIVMYVLALLCKPTSTPLPIMLLLMDYWPLKRLSWRTVREKLPFFIIGGISAVITYISQSRTAAVITPEAYGPMRIPLVICHNIIFYLYKIIWPANLSHYPFPESFGISSPMVMAGITGTCILIALLIISLRWTPALLTGWLIFFVAIFPTIQILEFSKVIASDKFVYLPSIGLLMVLAAFFNWLCGNAGISRHKIKCAVLIIIVLVLSIAESLAARRYLADWKDSVTLFSRMAKITPDSVSILHHLGLAFAEKGKPEQAIECFTKILKMKPDSAGVQLNLAKVLADQGRQGEAVSHYYEVLRLSPENAGAYYHLGLMLANQKRFDQAIAMFRKGIDAKPDNPSILHSALGTLLLQQGKIDEGIAELQTAVKLQPDAAAFNNLGVALTLKGKIDEAMECHKKAIQLDPKNAEAYYDLGNIMLTMGRVEQAIDEYKKALSVNPMYAKAHGNLAVAFAQQGRLDKAIEHFTKVSEIEPNNLGAHYNLAMALTNKGNLEQAAVEYRQVLRLQPGNADAHCALGDILTRLGRTEEAAAEYRQSLKIDPQHIGAQQGLSNVESGQHSGHTTQ